MCNFHGSGHQTQHVSKSTLEAIAGHFWEALWSLWEPKRHPSGAQVEGQNQGLEKWSKNGSQRPARTGSAAEGGRVLAGVRGLVRPRLWRVLACLQHGLRQPLADGPDPKGFALCRRAPLVAFVAAGLQIGAPP